MNTRLFISKLIELGCRHIRDGRHSIWESPEGKRIAVPSSHVTIHKWIADRLIKELELDSKGAC